MKKKLLKTGIIFLIISSINVFGQNKLYLMDRTADQSSFSIQEINKITFSSGNLLIEKSDFTKQLYGLENICFLSFTDFQSDIDATRISPDYNSYDFFPNPTDGQLTINFYSAANSLIQVDILSSQGHLIRQFKFSVNKGMNSRAIDLSKMKKGFYLCRINNGQHVFTKKIMKK